MKKFDAKKVLKKYKDGGHLKKEIMEDPKLAGGGAIHHPVKVTPQDRLKKKAEGGSVLREGEKPYQKELKSEVKGMGPEGKAYLRDELKGKKYEGKLKGKYKEDLDKELSGMHREGKEYLKDLVRKSVKREGEKAHKREGRAVMREGEKVFKEMKPLKPKSVVREGEFKAPKKRSVKREGEKVFKKMKPLKPKSVVREGEYKPSLGKIMESKVLKMKLREKEGIPKKNIVKAADGGWIQGAVKKPGALRAIAKKDKLIKGDEKLSASDLKTLGAKAKKSGNSLLAKRVSLAKTFAKMRKK